MNKEYQEAFNEIKEHITSKYHWWSITNRDEYLELLQEAINKAKKYDELQKVYFKNEPMESADLNGVKLQELYDFNSKLKEKETPKKIIRYSGMSYDYNEIDFFTCPNCRNLYKGQKYCDVCGQALSPEIYDGEIDEDRSDE